MKLNIISSALFKTIIFHNCHLVFLKMIFNQTKSISKYFFNFYNLLVQYFYKY